MARYSRSLHHRIFKNYSNDTQRRSQLKKAIERSTGIPISMLNVIEMGMEERKKHPVLQSFLGGQSRLPSSYKIISRLLTAPMEKKSTYVAENLFTEYRVSLRSSKGNIEVIAVMRLFRKKGIFSFAKSHGIISVRYIISNSDNVHEYRQDFILSKKRFVTTKHSALDYNSNIPAQWKTRLAPKLLAPPMTVYI
jgi:hypothetical protein